MANETEKYGAQVTNAADRWLVELWSNDPAERNWLLLGQTEEDRTAIAQWLTDGGEVAAESTKCERPLPDTLIRPRLHLVAA
jgi:hypothetical protein